MTSGSRTRYPCPFADCPRTFHYDLLECASMKRTEITHYAGLASGLPPLLDEESSDDVSDISSLRNAHLDESITMTHDQIVELAGSDKSFLWGISSKGEDYATGTSWIEKDVTSFRKDDPDVVAIRDARTLVDSRDIGLWVIGNPQAIQALQAARTQGEEHTVARFRADRINDLARGNRQWGEALRVQRDAAERALGHLSDAELADEIAKMKIFHGYPNVLVEYARRGGIAGKRIDIVRKGDSQWYLPTLVSTDS